MSSRLVLLILAVSSCVYSQNPWLLGVRSLLEDCPVKSARVDKDLTPSVGFVRALSSCARRRALLAIDDILQDDVIPIVEGLELVKYKYAVDGEKVDNNTVTFNIRKLLKRIHDKDQPNGQMEKDESSWREKLTSRLARVLNTHVIRIDVEQLRPCITDVTKVESSGRSSGLVEGRGRRKRQKMSMMPIAMMGILLMGSVLIPMGFQFLAVLGGKALILAKMALMLSSIQGLKKIATNGVNYGLYHSPVPEPWHERSGAHYEIPYNPGVHAAAAPAPAHHPHSPGYFDFISRSSD